MSDALDQAALEAAHATYERYGQEGDLRTQRLSDGCMSAVIRAYLSARSVPEAGKAVDDMAAILWRTEAIDVGSPPSIAAGRTRDAFNEQNEATKENWRKFARVALTASEAEAAGRKLEECVEAYFARQIEWSRETFGPALRTHGIIDHIRKELAEIAADPRDLSEWVDVVILAMDGFWRHGGSAADLMPRLLAKQQKNMARSWPDWRTMSEDQAIEHNRAGASQ